ncbi:MAG: hypothetical protein ACR2PT_02205 [Endozoicomonas sp.]
MNSISQMKKRMANAIEPFRLPDRKPFRGDARSPRSSRGTSTGLRKP